MSAISQLVGLTHLHIYTTVESSAVYRDPLRSLVNLQSLSFCSVTDRDNASYHLKLSSVASAKLDIRLETYFIPLVEYLDKRKGALVDYHQQYACT